MYVYLCLQDTTRSYHNSCYMNELQNRMYLALLRVNVVLHVGQVPMLVHYNFEDFVQIHTKIGTDSHL